MTYFDEVKSQPSQGQNYYFVGGICVPMDKIMEIESQLNNLAIELFETADLTPETCFHARLIHFKKGPFGNMDFPERLAVLKGLTEILANAPVKRVYVAIDYEKLKAKHKIADRVRPLLRACRDGESRRADNPDRRPGQSGVQEHDRGLRPLPNKRYAVGLGHQDHQYRGLGALRAIAPLPHDPACRHLPGKHPVRTAQRSLRQPDWLACSGRANSRARVRRA
ncbi:hypothetical protein, partial [Bradyrhizobium sp. 138]|uniref:hypothetical protein n=1 Tax=Bradyrhizobium sp. 138 TaxID=2782615 RepID=UPI001FF902E6